MLGAIVTGGGIAVGAAIIGIWFDRGFGGLAETQLAIAGRHARERSGIQIFFSSFLISILGLRRDR